MKQCLYYYDYDQVEEMLCKYIGIDQRYFQRYHEIVGGEYKNFWHILTDIYPVQNDSYQTRLLDAEWGEENGERSKPLFDAIRNLSKEVGEEIVVHFCW